MRSRLSVGVCALLLLSVVSCDYTSDRTSDGISAPDPLFDVTTQDLVPNSDFYVVGWLRTDCCYFYSNIDEVPASTADYIVHVNRVSSLAKFDFTDLPGGTTGAVVAIEVRLKAGFELETDDDATITVEYFLNGTSRGSHSFDYCCGTSGAEPDVDWSHVFNGLQLAPSALNSLQVQVTATHDGITPDHAIKVYNLNARVSIQSGSGGGGKGPDPGVPPCEGPECQ